MIWQLQWHRLYLIISSAMRSSLSHPMFAMFTLSSSLYPCHLILICMACVCRWSVMVVWKKLSEIQWKPRSSVCVIEFVWFNIGLVWFWCNMCVPHIHTSLYDPFLKYTWYVSYTSFTCICRLLRSFETRRHLCCAGPSRSLLPHVGLMLMLIWTLMRSGWIWECEMWWLSWLYVFDMLWCIVS